MTRGEFQGFLTGRREGAVLGAPGQRAGIVSRVSLVSMPLSPKYQGPAAYEAVSGGISITVAVVLGDGLRSDAFMQGSFSWDPHPALA